MCNGGFCVDDGGGTSVGTDMTSVDSTTTATTAGTSGVDASATGPSDTGPSDTGPSDTGPSDTGPSDTGPSDTGPSETGDTGGMVDLDAWTKRRPISIDNSLSVALTDHQVHITIPWDGDWEPTLDDLRFTDQAGTTLLPHWTESFTGGLSVDVWVRVPQVPANDVGTIYVYYGNPAALDASDPEATFLYFEPFNGNDIDGNDWIATGDYSVANGRLTVTSGSVYSVVPLATMPGDTLEVRSRTTENTGVGAGLSFGEAQTQTAMDFFGSIGLNQNQTEASLVDGGFWIVGTTILNGPGLNTFAYYGVGTNASYVQFEVNRGSDEDTTMAAVTGDFYVILGSAAGSLAGTTDVWSIDYEHVIVRRFALTEPEFFVGGEEDV